MARPSTSSGNSTEDSRIAVWLYTGPGVRRLRAAGFHTVVVDQPVPGHTDYLINLGFRAENGTLVKQL